MHTRLRKPLRAKHIASTAKRRAFNCIVTSALGTEEPELDRVVSAAKLVIAKRGKRLPLNLSIAINELDQALHKLENAK